jgi:hypothetical protein
MMILDGTERQGYGSLTYHCDGLPISKEEPLQFQAGTVILIPLVRNIFLPLFANLEHPQDFQDYKLTECAVL